MSIVNINTGSVNSSANIATERDTNSNIDYPLTKLVGGGSGSFNLVSANSTTPGATDVGLITRTFLYGLDDTNTVRAVEVDNTMPSASEWGMVVRPVVNDYNFGPVSLNTLNATTAMTASGYGDAAFFISGNYGGAVNLEFTVDGTNWFNLFGFSTQQQIMVNGLTGSATTIDTIMVTISGYYLVRARMGSFSSGQATIIIRGAEKGGIRRLAAYQANASLPTLVENQPTQAAVDLTGATYITHKPSSFVNTLEKKDQNRFVSSIHNGTVPVTSVTAEALMSLTRTITGTFGAATTVHSASSGKTLRISNITISSRPFTALGSLTNRFYLRMNSTGSATVNSAIIASLEITATTASNAPILMALPDALEFSGTNTFCLTHTGSAATGYSIVSITGYEYS